MDFDFSASSFFVTGGTLAPDAACYVERQSDEELFEWLQRGEFCYVLTARQMGKSSLMVRAAARLRQEEIRTVILDLTTLGQGVTLEQWYRGLLAIIGEQLELEGELERFWRERGELGPLQRWFAALQQVVLPHSAERLVLFIDEIDAVRGLGFSTDDFFAAIRAAANGSATRVEPRRLTFCLLGVATPSDLIRDTRNTPFNIGHRIELRDFTPAEARVFLRGLAQSHGKPPEAVEALLQRVLYWTAGQPYLSQRLCQAVAEDPAISSTRDVDRVCARLFFTAGALRRETHLLFAQELLLRSTDDPGGLLQLYGRVRSGRRVPDQEKDPFIATLRLSGVVRPDRGQLRLRNRIYARVFDGRWIAAHLPEAERRRQRAAFQRGGLLAGTVGLVVGLILAGFTLSLQRTIHERDRALLERQGTLNRLREAIAALHEERGTVERKADALWSSELREHAQRLAAEASERRASAATGRAELAKRLAELAKGLAERRGADARREVARLEIETGTRLVDEARYLDALPWFISASRLQSGGPSRPENALLISSLLAESPQLTQLWTSRSPVRGARFSPNGQWLAVARDDGAVELRPGAGGPVRQLQAPGAGMQALEFSDDSSQLLLSSWDGAVRIWRLPEGRRPVELAARAHAVYFGATWVGHGRQVVTLDDLGHLRLWDARTGALVREVGQVPSFYGAALLALGDGPLLLVITENRMRIVDLRSGTQTAEGPSSWESVAVARTDASGSLVAMVSGLEINIWRLPGLTRVSQFVSRREPKCVAFQPDGRLRVIGIDGGVQDWNPLNGVPLADPVQLSGPVSAAALLAPPAGVSCSRTVLTTDPAGVVRMWDLASRAERGRFLRPSVFSGEPAFDPSGKLAALPGADGTVRVLNTATGAARASWNVGVRLECAAFSPDGTWLAAAGAGGAPRLWSLRTGDRHADLAAPTRLAERERIYRLAFSPDSTKLLAFRTDLSAQLYDVASGRALLPLMPCSQSESIFQPFSPNGRRVVLQAPGGQDCQLWVLMGDHLRRGPLLQKAAGWAQFSPDGRTVLTWNNDQTIRLWKVVDGKPIRGNLPRGERITFAAFSPQGDRIATVDSSTGTTSLWDSHTFQPLMRPLAYHAGATRLAFSPDGRRLALAAANGVLQVWDLGRNQLLVAPFNVRLDVEPGLEVERVRELRFSADGQCVLAGFPRWGAVVLPLQYDPRPLQNPDALTASYLGQMPGGPLSPQQLALSAVARNWKTVSHSLARSPAELQEAERRWHREQWAGCEQAALWPAAATHLTALLQADPASWELRERRALTYAHMENWGEAARDFRAVRDQRPGDYLGHYWCALTQLAAGDGSGYRQTCARMLDQFATDPRERPRDLTAWTCALGEIDAADRRRAIAVLEKMLQAKPDQQSWRSTLGALLCRDGRYAEALRDLMPASTEPKVALDDLFRARAYQGLGRFQEARAALSLGEQAVARGLDPATQFNPSWEDRLEATVLLAGVRIALAAPSRGRTR